MISVGEEVTGMLNLNATNFPQLLFALTAPADGTVIFHLSGDQGLTLWVTDDPSLSFEAWSQIFVGDSLHLFAGVTYLVAVEDCCPWDRDTIAGTLNGTFAVTSRTSAPFWPHTSTCSNARHGFELRRR